MNPYIRTIVCNIVTEICSKTGIKFAGLSYDSYGYGTCFPPQSAIRNRTRTRTSTAVPVSYGTVLYRNFLLVLVLVQQGGREGGGAVGGGRVRGSCHHPCRRAASIIRTSSTTWKQWPGFDLLRMETICHVFNILIVWDILSICA